KDGLSYLNARLNLLSKAMNLLASPTVPNSSEERARSLKALAELQVVLRIWSQALDRLQEYLEQGQESNYGLSTPSILLTSSEASSSQAMSGDQLSLL